MIKDLHCHNKLQIPLQKSSANMLSLLIIILDSKNRLPCIAKIRDKSHRKKFECRFKKEDHSQDSIQIVKAVN
jgi:hypothetical protein